MNLYSPYKLKDMEIRNRIDMPPMCMYSAKEGLVDEFHIMHYSTRAMGGAGLIIVEATGITMNGRITKDDLGIWSDDHVEGLAILAGSIRKSGAKAAIQLAHAGRKSTVEFSRVVAPSPIPFDGDSRTPDEMTKYDIEEVVSSFGKGARRALEAGFDMIEIHAAHGYLINEFLSPLTNKRCDEYGGSLENRTRLLAQVLTEVRKHWPKEKPLCVRISASDFAEGGNTPSDLSKMLNIVKHVGIDLIDVSGGGLVPIIPDSYPGYQIGFAETVKKETGLNVIGGGLITDAKMANDIVSSGKSDLVFIGRELLRNPFWPLISAGELGIQASWPKQYERARKHQ
jgi:NADPH2 dehydrogenase